MSEFCDNALLPEAFQHVDDYIDCFSRIKAVTSDLLYGEPNRTERIWLSVVIPTYQRGHELREALQSVLAQKQVGYIWEILVVDNTPLDCYGTTPALHEIQRIGDPNVLYYHNRRNIGSGYNWNRGVELSRGEWVCFLHDDDVLCSDALEKIGRQILQSTSREQLGFLYARRLDFSGDFVEIRKRKFPAERLTRFGMLLSGCTGAGAPSCGTTILKEAYMKAGGINYDFGLSADAVLCYQIMKHYRAIISNHILGGYRWSVNESLKLDALLQMVQADELLSLYSYQQGPFARWWGRMFGDASSWRNIHRKLAVAKKSGIAVSKEEFRKVTSFTEPSKLKKLVFLGIYALYRLWRLADGWVRQFIIKMAGGRFHDKGFD